ncbi:hypothetical protein WJX84_009805 [Apatococcus fuscideae]|uniref:Uncharacterized protein n=1 Tax=Apatococcus fuscideae TaxID=2026836 RepID=A0AAW1SVT5_9CHLO
MRGAVVLLSLLSLASLSLASRDEHLQAVLTAKQDPKASFAYWVQKHGKAYLSDLEEYERKFLVWLDNLEFITTYNEQHTSHWLGLNGLADMSHEEFKSQSFGYRPDLRNDSQLQQTPFKYADVETPNSVDWHAKGAVTKVKNQAQCGSCWAFSTTGSVEGINAIVSGELTSLSEQELVDCDTSRDHGCHGGLMDFAFSFIMQNGGIDTERDYKYLALEEACNPKKEHRHIVTIDGYQDVPPNDEKSLLKAVANQPVSVAIEADQREFQLYQGGVFDAPCGTALDHGVLVTGYGTDEDGNDYWTVKNSWGPLWGDQGFIKLARGIENAAGQCGVAMQASYPIKNGPNPPAPGPEPPTPPTPPTPPSPPAPVVCDQSSSCPNGQTCCCMRDFFGYCFAWACCPLKEATCCDDHIHCCPNSLPVCDTVAARCLASAGAGYEGSVPWSTKSPAQQTPQGNRYIDNFLNTVMGEGAADLYQSQSTSVSAFSGYDATVAAAEEAAEELTQQPRMAIS